MKLFLLIVLGLTLTASFGQIKNSDSKKIKFKNELFESIFPIDNIKSITVTNLKGTYTLNSTELAALKKDLKKSKFRINRLVKPSRIILKISLTDNSTLKTGTVYGKKGLMHFQDGIDKFGRKLNATVYLPIKLNFDSYK